MSKEVADSAWTTAQRDDLKPCPFCGTKAIEQGRTANSDTSTQWRIQCGNPFCDITCQSHVFAALSQAENAWQERECGDTKPFEDAAREWATLALKQEVEQRNAVDDCAAIAEWYEGDCQTARAIRTRYNLPGLKFKKHDNSLPCYLDLRRKRLDGSAAVLSSVGDEDPKSMGLSATVVDSHISVSIGVGALAFAFEHSEGNNPFDEASNDYRQRYQIGDPLQFAEDVCRAMNDEAEDGSTPLTRFLDSMMNEAVDQGSLGILDPDEPDGTADSPVSEHR